LRLDLRPRLVREREAAEGGVERCHVRGSLVERIHAAFDPGNVNVGAELLDILRRQRVGKHAGHAAPGVRRGPVAGGVVPDGVRADIAVMQVGEAFVEIRRVVGSAVVPVFGASLEVELQTGLKREGEVAEPA